MTSACVGLTGGIGSGKSTVGVMLRDRGAVVIEADEVVHHLQQPGQEVFDRIVSRFGKSVLSADGGLDRDGLASIVFEDPAARRDLEEIVHPAVGVELARLRTEAQAAGSPVVLDIPLLAEAGADAKGRWALDGVIVVDCPVETALERLVSLRDMPEAQARARLAAQVSREERLSIADFVVDNSGDLAQLGDEVERCWAWIVALRS